MAEENKLEVQIVLEDGSVVKGFAKIEKEAEKTAKKSQGFFEDFIGAGKSVASAVAIASAAFGTFALAASAAFKQVLAGEELKKIEQQFSSLAQSAGLAGSDLAKRFNESLGGLADESGAFQVLNEGIIRLGANADRLPEVFTLARKATNLFGGDAIENFRKLEEAIANGNTRQLRSLGLRIDETKALKTYADQVGVAVDLLSQEAKQQAILNAVLEQGNVRFRNVAVENGTATEALKRLTVSFSNLGEEIQKLTAEAFGPFFRNVLNGLNDIAISLTNKLKPGSLAFVEQELGKIDERLKAIKQNNLESTLNGETDALIRQREILLERQKLLKFTEQQNSDLEEMEKARSMSGEQRIVDEQKFAELSKQNLMKYNQEFIKLQSDRQQAQLQLNLVGATEEETNRLKTEELERQHQLRLEQITTQFKGQAGISTQQFNLLIEEENMRHAANVEKITADSANRVLQIRKQEQDAQVAIVKNGLTRGIESIGAALVRGENLFDGFKNAVLGIFGDLFIRIGQGLLFQGLAIETFIQAINSLFPGSGAAAAAAGLGLIVFGGALKALAGGGGGASTSAPAGAGGGVAGGIAAPIDAQNPTQIAETEALPTGPRIEVNIAGDVLDSQETGIRIVDLINQAFDQNGAVVTGAV